VAIQFVVPSSNTDGSTPADLSRVEVYALTGAATVSSDEILRRGARVGRLAVNQPRDPDETEEDTRRREAVRVPDALDQGATARFADALVIDPTRDGSEVRAYLAVGFNMRGRRGAFSTRGLIPVGEAPAVPSQPHVTWDETTITVTWMAPDAAPDLAAYHVYAPGEIERRLTEQPVAEPRFLDRRIEWGAERCYLVRTAVTVENLSLESDGSPKTCVTLADTFPPAAPDGLITIAAEGAVNLIWNSNREVDLAGYLVLRAIAPETTPVAITPAPVLQPTFTDPVPPGSRVTYALQAVDKAGNVSPLSARVEETAR
jgi:hypothetical protein